MSQSALELTIASREEQAEGIVVLDLVAPDGRPLPAFEAGAHVDVHIAPDLIRQYSLCGDPADHTRYRLGILRERESRGGSHAIHQRFLAGERVRIGLPRNQFHLVADAGRSILLAGGIGVTPMLSMAYELHARGREFDFHYCARSRRSAAFLSELERAGFRDRVRLHFDDEPEEQRLQLARDLPAPSGGIQIYVCGPSGFMEWAISGARQLGYPESQVHREYFSAEVDTAGDAFEVVLAKSGRTIKVPGGTTIVKALADIGVKVDVSCEQGVCGTCLCDVIEGVPDHRDSYLTGEEHEANDQMTLCCSRSKTPRLVIGL